MKLGSWLVQDIAAPAASQLLEWCCCWLQLVLEVKAAVEQLHPGTKFNSCLLNLYKDGNHHVSWHADNEKL